MAPVRAQGIHHIGIVVDDLDAGIAFVQRVFGLGEPRLFDVPERRRRVAIFAFAGIELEVAAFDGETETRIDHIAVEVADLEATLSALEEQGVEIAPPGVIEDSWSERPIGRWAFTRPETADGVRWQFLERSR